MTFWTEYGVGAVSAGESFVAFRPKIPVAGKRGILFAHGAGSLSSMAVDYPGANRLLAGLAAAGHPIVSGDFGGATTWGNDTAMARMTTAKAYLHSAMGAPTGKIHLAGVSMGGQNCLAWAAANPTLVSSVSAMIPVVNPTDIVTNNRQGAAASVNGAYSGGWSEATYGATKNPKTMAAAAKYAGMPIRMLYGTSDLICVPAEATAFATLVGASLTAVSMNSAHDLSQWSDALQIAGLAFVAQNNA